MIETMRPAARTALGVLLLGVTVLMFGIGSFAIDPAIGPWGLMLPLLFAIAAGLLAIPMYRVASPLGPYRWLVVAVQLALPAYLVFSATHFYVNW